MKRLTIALFLLPLIMGCGCRWCTERVPAGYVGMVMTPEGFVGPVLQPGNHSCYGRDRLVLIETREDTVAEPMSILCKDDLNFKFDLYVRARLRSIQDEESFREVLNRKGADMQGGKDDITRILTFDSLYKTYIKPVARSVARGEVSVFETTQVRDNRASIEKAILQKLVKAADNTPLEVVAVTTSNFDYPDVITKAVEKKRKREIEIQEERAKQAMELLRADNRLKLAERMKQVKAAEAEADAVYIDILGKSLNKNYLDWKRIERDRILYERVQAGDKVIVSGQAMPIVNSLPHTPAK